jgi:DNA-binding CsgD family transcriptional regulator
MTELTSREKKVLKLICDDKSNQEIADKLELSLRVVEKAKTRLYTKTKTRSGVGLLKWALVNKLYKMRKF